jgi:hypothetical protein
MSKQRSHLAFVVIASLLLAGCPGIVPGSRPYQAGSPLEAEHLKQANFKIFPDDVRADPTKFKETMIAWAGVVTNAEIKKEGGSYLIIFSLEHHYFDWIEDDSIQKAIFFLSPRGEGAFKTYWSVPLSKDYEELKRQVSAGTLLITFGYPVKVDGGTIYIRPDYVRPYERALYSTDALDYGRPGSPVKVLKTPMH